MTFLEFVVASDIYKILLVDILQRWNLHFWIIFINRVILSSTSHISNNLRKGKVVTDKITGKMFWFYGGKSIFFWGKGMEWLKIFFFSL